MRRCTADKLIAVLNLQNMSVLNAPMETNHFVAQLLVKRIKQFISLFAGNVASRMILDFTIFDADKVTTHHHLSIVYRNTRTRTFERAAPFEHFSDVVAQNL